MDPISCAAGAASLVVSVATVSTTLYKLSRAIGGVGTRISKLSGEVKRLDGFLRSVETAISNCRKGPLTLAHVDGGMWALIDCALGDCNVAVEELRALVVKIAGEDGVFSENQIKAAHKARLCYRFIANRDGVLGLTQKIYQSNCSMQTALAVLNVSLTFRTRETQDLLFGQLQKLQEAVNRSMQASARQSDRQSANLGHLALTAQRFYNAASSTAGTQVGESEAASVLASRRRESIGIWRDGLPPVQESPEAAPSDDASTMRTEADEESDVELDVLRNLEVLAHANFVAKDYSAAERCLQKVLNRATSGNRDLGLLKTQLAFCCCLQGRWEQATTTMDPLPETDSGPAFLPALHILQAVSMVHLRQQRLDDAEATCMVVVNGKKSALGKEHEGYYESLSILSAIWRRRGDLMVSEAVCLNIPRDWRPPLDITELSPRRYILRHRTVLDSVFPDRATGNYPPLPALSATLGSVRHASAPASGASRHRLQFLPSRQENWSENHPTQQVTGSRLNAGIHLATTVIPTTKARLDDDGENITPCKVLELPIARPRASAPGAQRSSLRLPLQPLPASPLNLSGPTQQRNVLGYELPALAENRLRTSRSGYLVESQALALRHELRKMRSANFGYSTSPNH